MECYQCNMFSSLAICCCRFSQSPSKCGRSCDIVNPRANLQSRSSSRLASVHLQPSPTSRLASTHLPTCSCVQRYVGPAQHRLDVNQIVTSQVSVEFLLSWNFAIVRLVKLLPVSVALQQLLVSGVRTGVQAIAVCQVYFECPICVVIQI